MNSYGDVLIVDDDPIVRTVLRGYFDSISAGSVQDAGDGATAANIVRDFPGSFDLIVTDLSMPDEDGVQLLRRLHDQGFRGDVVIASGRDRSIIETAHSLAKGHSLKVRGCISKPLTRCKLDEVFLNDKTPNAPTKHPVELDADTLSLLCTEQRFTPYFQPKIGLRTGKIVGAEALVRAEHEELGYLGAYQLVTAARVHNMMGELTDIMARKAFDQLSLWQGQGINLDLALNVDPRQLCELDLPDRLSRLVRELGLQPSRIIIEVTEESLYSGFLQVMDVLARLRMKGFRTSVDDFGTGRSNIDTLQSLPFTELKIDQSFVFQALTHSFADVAIQTAVKLGKAAGLDLVAEGVETQDQLHYLMDLKIDVIQGYLFGRPMPAAEFERWYRDNDGYAPAGLFKKNAFSQPCPLPDLTNRHTSATLQGN